MASKPDEVREGVELTNLDQSLFDGADATKRDLVDYLDAISDRLLPGLQDRPLSVIRVHRGQEAFMQKNVPKYTPEFVPTVELWAESSKRKVRYAICNDRRTLLWFGNQRAVEYHPTLVSLAGAVDTLISVVPGGASTAKAVNAEVLKALGPDGVFVNIGRGSTVDEDALAAALKDGTIFAAGLDVFADEPNVPEALLGLDNVVLSPHQGSATHKTRWAMGDLVVRNLKAHFAGEPLISPVV